MMNFGVTFMENDNIKWVEIMGFSMPHWCSVVSHVYHSEVLLLKHMYEPNSNN